METLKLALDWTPNINHIGFFVAKRKGFYKELGLDLEIIDPSTDSYKITPAKKVELAMADFALCPTESIISYRTKENSFDLIAIAAVLQEDLSAIVVKSDVGIDSPKDLDGKIYGSYCAKYEDGIVREMIKNDGGEGKLEIRYPNKLGIWNRLLEGECDATWVFMNWEGVEVSASAHQFNYFKMSDYQIPYSYSPVIAAGESKIESNLAQYKSFLKGTKKGFLYCQRYPEQSIAILQEYIPKQDGKINLKAALESTSPYFGNENNWGMMNKTTIANFVNWIDNKKLEHKPIDISNIYTHRCFY